MLGRDGRTLPLGHAGQALKLALVGGMAAETLFLLQPTDELALCPEGTPGGKAKP